MGNHRRIGQEAPTPQPPISPTNYTTIRSNGGAIFLRPGMCLIIGVLATVFTLILVLIVYTRHLRSRRNENLYNSVSRAFGVQKSVVDSLPLFRFGIGTLHGQKNDHDCAVCLFPYEYREYLRLLPKCRHAFHVVCIDTWLDTHTTCPLCRSPVEPEDLLLIPDLNLDLNPNPEEEEVEEVVVEGMNDIADRHSSAREKSTTNEISPHEILMISESDGAAFPARKDACLHPEESGKSFDHRIILSGEGGENSKMLSDLGALDLLVWKKDQMVTMHDVTEGRASCSSLSDRGGREKSVVLMARSQSEHIVKSVQRDTQQNQSEEITELHRWFRGIMRKDRE